ncbi:hypothetical protein GE115_11875 [Agromyces sp. CFH 90414]|uniref:ChbG/HpnK family deacetylase n=1 Tax=Agromyces agglutinans TaxID=2662258 RepID=A0A6I2FIH5_9MICO|nr:hypothetical protein [Agromyces agglutinans]MRG60558.1 hypothetical protein [Agromyces agglutinans]
MHEVFVTIDVDWAPDWAMHGLLDTLLEGGVRSTWFITHESDMLDELRRHPDLVDLGIHPNFQPGSSHGADPVSVIAECMRIVPEALTMRTHCLVQSTPILQAVVDHSPVVLDSSLYVRDLTDVTVSELPLDHGRSLARAPYVWEDDLEFFAPAPRWDGHAFLAERDSLDELTIVDLHPIHVALNSATPVNYHALRSFHGGDVRRARASDAIDYLHRGPGAATFLADLVSASGTGAFEFGTPLADLAVRTRSSRELRHSA